MVAVDTNVVVRLLTNDHAAQAKRAVALFRANPIFVAKSVLLETEWVLRYSYGAAAERFATFDARLIKRAGGVSPLVVAPV